MKSGDGLALLGIGLLLLGAWRWVNNDSGGDLATEAPSPSSKRSSIAVDRSVPADDSPAEVAARLSQPQATQLTSPGSDPAWTGVLSPAALSSYEDSFLPTEAGLIDITIGLWANEDFMSLTQDEAHDLLALDDSMGMRGPSSMLSIVGPLPTEDDCRVGFRSPAVQAALQEVCAYDIALVELGRVPIVRRCAGSQERIEDLIRLRDGAMEGLMAELERATTCGTWRLWNRMWRLFSR